ncbi:hypothetical protein Syn7502_02593 [Synechococcus sp. PCC 7502]|uniref:helix-turn-helix domain-containing protein n=1 Tax=Synechococcus sp. PCC 7502 TaxID=1173263 RepID=UPI00029F8E34|nr:RodZ domain-containing protein [Synechococcus sp. PCC 7502]AFY74556.1 hypothetical protein Syn7502_02593 [Synechococcus sp. PCC 7502]
MKVSSKEQQALKLAEIGSQLKRIREQKKISLQKINQITLISQRHLQAIEEGNISRLPEPVYIQGFIRKYGNVLGVSQIAEQFPLVNSVPKSSWFKSSELRPLHLYLIYIVVISASIGALSNVLNPNANYNTISDSEVQLSNAAKLNSNPPSGSIFNQLIPKSNSTLIQPLLNKSQPLLPQQKPVNVGVAMKGESWMRVEVDGEVKFEGILSEGSSKTWTANKNITLRAGNAAAVLLVFNNYPPQALGQAGEVVQKTFDSNFKPTNITTKLSLLPEGQQ